MFLAAIAGGITLVVGLVVIMGISALRRSRRRSYEEQISDLLEDEIGMYEGPSGSSSPTGVLSKWSRYWDVTFKELGWSRYNDDPLRAGREVMLATGAVAVVASALTMNLFIGMSFAGLVIFMLSYVLNIISFQKAEKIGQQLPGFLFALKANIQANETPERSILKVIDSMPRPLYDDLSIVRDHILANSSFKDALLEMSRKTASRDLKFLAACMIQAASSGADLESQIETIQKVLDQRQIISDEISKAARAATPAMWASSIAIPGVFLAIFFFDPNAQGFWFVNPVSWVIFAAIIILWVAGIVLSRRLVSSIRNM